MDKLAAGIVAVRIMGNTLSSIILDAKDTFTDYRHIYGSACPWMTHVKFCIVAIILAVSTLAIYLLARKP